MEYYFLGEKEKVKNVKQKDNINNLFFNIKEKKLDNQNIKLGFYGNIDDKIDYQLIQNMIDVDNRLIIEMIGKIDQNIKKFFKNNPRINYIPALNYKELSNKIDGWDILFFPFLNNKGLCCSDLKLKEFLATGKPVISTDIHVSKEYNEFIETKNGLGEWVSGLKKITSDSYQNKEKRLNKIRCLLMAENQCDRTKELNQRT